MAEHMGFRGGGEIGSSALVKFHIHIRYPNRLAPLRCEHMSLENKETDPRCSTNLGVSENQWHLKP